MHNHRCRFRQRKRWFRCCLPHIALMTGYPPSTPELPLAPGIVSTTSLKSYWKCTLGRILMAVAIILSTKWITTDLTINVLGWLLIIFLSRKPSVSEIISAHCCVHSQRRCICAGDLPLPQPLVEEIPGSEITLAFSRMTNQRAAGPDGLHAECYFRMHNAGLQACTCCRQGLVFGKMLSYVFKNQTVEKWQLSSIKKTGL